MKDKIVQYLPTYVVASVMTFLILTTTAHADAVPIDPSNSLGTVHLNALIVQALVAFVIPVLIGLVTNYKDSSVLKKGAEIVLNAITAFIVQATMVDGSAVFSKQTFFVWLIGLGASLAAYKGWKAAGITSSAIPLPGAEPGSIVMVPGKLSSVGLRTLPEKAAA